MHHGENTETGQPPPPQVTGERGPEARGQGLGPAMSGPGGRDGGDTGLEAGMPAVLCPVSSVLSALNVLSLGFKIEFAVCVAYEVGIL